MPKKYFTRQQKEQAQQTAIATAQSEFFGGITKQEAIDIFKVLAVLVQFPGAEPPEPLTGCEVKWTSVMSVGNTLDKQRFTVQAIYKNMTFIYTALGDRVIQLPDSSFLNLESWDYQALLLSNRVLSNLKVANKEEI
jgi:hypothetical protein